MLRSASLIMAEGSSYFRWRDQKRNWLGASILLESRVYVFSFVPILLRNVRSTGIRSTAYWKAILSQAALPNSLAFRVWVLFISTSNHGGGKRTANMREVMNRLMHVLSTGCQWRAIPKDLPPNGTVYGYFDLWIYGGTLDRIHHALT